MKRGRPPSLEARGEDGEADDEQTNGARLGSVSVNALRFHNLRAHALQPGGASQRSGKVAADRRAGIAEGNGGAYVMEVDHSFTGGE